MAPKVKVKKNINDQSKWQKNNKFKSQKLLSEYFEISQKCSYATKNIESLMNKQNGLIREQKKLRYDILRAQNQVIMQVNFLYENALKNADHEEYNIFTNFFTEDKPQNNQNEQCLKESSTLTMSNLIDEGISKQIQTLNDDARVKACSEKNQQHQKRSDFDKKQSFNKKNKQGGNLDQYRFSKIKQKLRTQQIYSKKLQKQNQLLSSPLSTVTIQSSKLQSKFNLDQFAYETVVRNNQNQNTNRQIVYNEFMCISLQDGIQGRKQMPDYCQNLNTMVNQFEQNLSENSQRNFDNLKIHLNYDSQMNFQVSKITSIGQTINFSQVKSPKRKLSNNEFESMFSLMKCDFFEQINFEPEDKYHKLNQIIASLERIKSLLDKKHNAKSKASSFHQALHQTNNKKTELKLKQSNSWLIKQFEDEKIYPQSISFVDQNVTKQNNFEIQQIQEVQIIMHRKQFENDNHLDSCTSDFDILDYILGRQPYCQYYFQNLNQSNYFSQQMSDKVFSVNQISTKSTKNQVEITQPLFQIPQQYLTGYKRQIFKLFSNIHTLQLQKEDYKENQSHIFHC